MKLKISPTLIFGWMLSFFVLESALAQSLTVSISSSGFSANSCSRILTANVTGGSGSYSYQWSLTAPGVSFPGSKTTQTVTSSLNITTNFIVFVRDNTTGSTGSTSITVPRVLLGSLDIFIPNIFTPNGDGFNDVWFVADANSAFGAINAYRYELGIANASGQTIFSRSQTISQGTIGLLGGDIAWNGRINGAGSTVPNGVYTYSLRLVNCSASQLLTGFIQVFGSSFSITVSPNPATDFITVGVSSQPYQENMAIEKPYSVKLFNDRQELVKTAENLKENISLTVADLPRGAYIMHIISEEDISINRIWLE